MDKVEKFLLHVGVPADVKGYRYICDAVRLIEEDHTYQYALMKRLYPGVGERNHVTATAVERAIRHAVEAAFDRMPLELQEKLFGNTISFRKGKATNGEFLAVMALHLKGEGV